MDSQCWHAAGYWLDDHGSCPMPVWRWIVWTVAKSPPVRWRRGTLSSHLESRRLWFRGSSRACFRALLWFPDYKHFGFQGLHVANGGEDRSFHLMEGSGTNPDIRSSPLIPPPRGGAASGRTGAVKRTGDGREQRGCTASRTTHPLSGVGLPLSYSDFHVKPTGRGRDWKSPPAISLRPCHFVRI